MTNLQHWVLVAGTGRPSGLPEAVCFLSEEIGRALGESGHGLIVGGWPGVDHIAARGLASVVASRHAALSDNLIQVLAEKRPAVYPAGAGYPDFSGGHLQKVPTGVREWVEALKYSDSVVLIGGEGGTLETFNYAVQEQRPTFPVLASGGDAEIAFRECLERWDTMPFEGISRSDFQRVLSQPIGDSQDARALAKGVIELLDRRFAYEAAGMRRNGGIFVSYAHEDRHWCQKLRSVLRPLERSVEVSVWVDEQLKPGDRFEARIAEAIGLARVAILLVSDAFLKSKFILQKELPWLQERERQSRGGFRMLWVPVEPAAWQRSELAHIIALSDPTKPLSLLPPAAQQDALVRARMVVSKALAETASLETA